MDEAWLEEVRASLPEMPAQKRRRFVDEYRIPEYDAGVLVFVPEVADYFERVARASGNAKAASNWVMTEVLRKLKEGERPTDGGPVTPERLAELLKLVDGGLITGTSAKQVFERMWATGEGARAIVEREGLAQVSDTAALQAHVDAVIAASPEQVAAYRKGKTSTARPPAGANRIDAECISIALVGDFDKTVPTPTQLRRLAQLVNALLKKALEA